MEQNLPPLIAAMTQREFYPHRPFEVELRQTHISYVFMAGPYVYKIKKPLRFPFVDYSTLEKRHHFCKEEIRLNRRLAPASYLGVVRLCRAGESFFLAEESSFAAEVIEYAVKMARLPEEQMLSSRVRGGSLEPGQISAIAKRLASFHRKASVEKAELYGNPRAVGARVRSNFQQTRPFIERTISPKFFSRIQDYSEAFLNEHLALFQSRIAEGRVREGHGDLRAEHICLVDDIVIFDCVEFDEGLRYVDVASEISFLSMDLDFLGASPLSAELEDHYGFEAQDARLGTLLPFYKCYRAYIRGLVESLKIDEQEISALQRRMASLEAQRYFCLALRYARGANQRMLLVACGMVGTGKSTVARLLSALTGFPVLNSDQMRKRLAGLRPAIRLKEAYHEGIYNKEFTQATYHALFEEAKNHLERGAGVILDASFRDPEHRRLLMGRVANAGVPVLFIECEADEKTVRDRLGERAKDREEISDATWEIYERMRADFPPFFDIPHSCFLRIDTRHSLLPALDRLEERLRFAFH